MRKLGGLVFLLPVILLSIFLWRDYTGEINELNDNPPELEEIYYFDDGQKAVSVSYKEFRQNMLLQMFDTGSGQILKEAEIISDIHGQLVASYQKNSLVISSHDQSRGLQVNVLNASGNLQELVQSTLDIPTFLSSDMKPWRGRLIVAGETTGDTLYVAQIRDGTLEKVNLNTEGLFPARPERMAAVSSSFEQGMAVPMYKVDLVNDRTAYISGILDQNKQPVVVMQPEEGSSFEAEEQAAAQFAKHFALDDTKLVRVNSSFPEQAHYYNASTGDWGSVVPTPQPVYQARVYTLNSEEVLIAGSSTEDERDGQVIGYLLHEETGQFTDVSSLVGQLGYEELMQAETAFYKESGSSKLYYSAQGKSAGMMDVANQAVQHLTEEQVQQWRFADQSKISLQSFWVYLREGGALVINWLVWVVISLFTFISLIFAPKIANRVNKSAIANGEIRQGTIVGMRETGLYVNERPQVEFMVRFEDGGQMREVAIKKVISFLEGIREGDTVMISYHRKRNKAIFLTGDQAVNHAPPDGQQRIERAVLERIDPYGAVGRGQALLLHFKAGTDRYSVPVVQAAGFEYQIGERANLMVVGGVTRILGYGPSMRSIDENMLTLQGKIVHIKKESVTIQNRRLMVIDVVVTEGAEQLRKSNSLFVPENMPIQEGVTLPISIRKDDLDKERRLLRGKQGSARIVSASYLGTVGERPVARITVERAGTHYNIEQSIEPLYGVQEGDELWIAYDESTREALILNYTS
ncbi:hypothetical protein [Paenibacillus sanguinis]|uniref:hypothetical protein n=1 Tax=Paenibacillus sanguinis TaxID=225906 RepID=UPI00035E530A|nr:hypothetical protein [Paenibacillus sanguinis]